MLFRRRTNGKKMRTCPRCREKLQWRERVCVCTRCLLIWHGDTFEPLTKDDFSSQYDDYFFGT